MSNATEPSRQSGERRRRRSRGGRNNNHNRNNQRRGQDGSDSNRSGGPRPKRSPRGRRKPVQLTWWQKLLKAVGLYKEPTHSKGKRKDDAARPPKSNTRIARTKSDDTKPTAERKGPRKGNKRSGGDPSTVQDARVYVGNLSFDVTEQDLMELFKGVGTVRNAEIVYNRNTHRSKGFGFVEMIHKDDAIRAVEVLHDQPFMGRELIVSGAKSKEQEDAENDPEEKSETVAVELAPLPAEKTAEVEESAPAGDPVEQTAAEEEAPEAEDAEKQPANS